MNSKFSTSPDSHTAQLKNSRPVSSLNKTIPLEYHYNGSLTPKPSKHPYRSSNKKPYHASKDYARSFTQLKLKNRIEQSYKSKPKLHNDYHKKNDVNCNLGTTLNKEMDEINNFMNLLIAINNKYKEIQTHYNAKILLANSKRNNHWKRISNNRSGNGTKTPNPLFRYNPEIGRAHV